MSAVGSILTNTGALQALNSISNTSATTTNLQTQLSSGLSINSPANNPAGYITAQGFTSQLNGITQAISNANQGVSLLQTAQGAISQQIGVTQQLNSIAVQAANGTQTSSESQSLQNLVSQLTGQVSTIANQTQFNNISLLNGTFSGVQFQVGANEGQTQSLSIGNMTASAIGMNASVASATVFKSGNAAAGSGQVTTAAAGPATVGAYTAGTAKIIGANGGSGSVTSTTGESAASIATAINNLSGTTGVEAQATNSVVLAATFVAGKALSFSLQAGSGLTGSIGTAQSIAASSANALVSQINGGTSTSGITASLNKAGNVVLSQSAGQNMVLNYTGAGASGSLATVGGTAATFSSTNKNAVIQGQTQLQSSGAFSVSGGAAIGVKSASTLDSLSAINVSTTTGANQAINVVKYALAALNNQGGKLGATQQSMTANINNLNTTSQNVTTALGVVQDANIPAVSNQLTSAQIQAQAGVAALKSSTQLQQSYLSLLP
jgi:flagellin